MLSCINCSKGGEDRGFAADVDEALSIVFTSNEEELDKPGLFLFRNESGLYCFICLCQELDVCINCLESAETLTCDARCNAKPFVCEICITLEARNHLYECYSDGCMTPGEFAQMEYEMNLADESEELGL